jgi:hypothetical protein
MKFVTYHVHDSHLVHLTGAPQQWNLEEASSISKADADVDVVERER